MRGARVTAVTILGLLAAYCGGGGGGGGPSGSLSLSKPAGSGDGQSGEVGHSLALPLKVLVRRDSSADSGQVVTWAATGGGSVAPTSSHADASGIATTTWTLGAAGGAQTATATVGGAAGSPLSYGATAIAPVIARAATSGNGQTDTVHATLADSLRVVVTFNGTPAAGRVVTWSTQNAGGSVTAADTTAADGTATARWKLGTAAGAQAASATTPGAPTPAAFSATARPGLAKTLQKASGDNQTADTGHTFSNQLVVKAADQFGNGRTGSTVTWSISSGSGHVTAVTDTTVGTGTAAATLVAGDTLGPVVVLATSSGLTGSPVSFSGTVAHAPTTISIGDDFFSPDSVTIHAGDQVKWAWGNTVVHNVTSTGSPSFTGSGSQGANTTYGPITFASTGVYRYYCTIHGTPTAGMKGVIVVVP